MGRNGSRMPVRELNWADYVARNSTPADAMRRILADAATMRAGAIYVPSDLSPDKYLVELDYALDRPLPGEPGQSTFARMLVSRDLVIYGDGKDQSVICFSAAPAQRYAALRLCQPFSLTLRDITLRNLRAPTVVQEQETIGVEIPPRTPTPGHDISTPHQLVIEQAAIRDFDFCTNAGAGSTGSINHFAEVIRGSTLLAHRTPVVMFNDAMSEATKRLSMSDSVLSLVDPKASWASHLVYCHPNVDVDAERVRFTHFAGWAFHCWSSPKSQLGARTIAFRDCIFEDGGWAWITHPLTPMQVEGGLVACRGVVQARSQFVMRGCIVRPKWDGSGGTASLFAAAPGAKLSLVDVDVSLDDCGDRLISVCDAGSGASDWYVSNLDVHYRRRIGYVKIFSGSPGCSPQVDARDIRINGYHVPDANAGFEQQAMSIVASAGGSFRLRGVRARGDVVHDGGAFRFDAGWTSRIDLADSEILAQRGPVIVSKAGALGSFSARDCQLDGPSVTVGGTAVAIR